MRTAVVQAKFGAVYELPASVPHAVPVKIKPRAPFTACGPALSLGPRGGDIASYAYREGNVLEEDLAKPLRGRTPLAAAGHWAAEARRGAARLVP